MSRTHLDKPLFSLLGPLRARTHERRPFRPLPYLALIAAAGALLASPPTALPHPIPPTCDTAAAASQPDRTLELFVRTAVIRRNLACSYDLVTANLRLGLTRRQWATGDIPVVPMPTKRPRALHLRILERHRTQGELSRIVLVQTPDVGSAIFDIAVVKRGDRWLVDYWGPATTFTAPTP